MIKLWLLVDLYYDAAAQRVEQNMFSKLAFYFLSRIKARLEEHKPERVKPFMTGAAEQIKHILANFKNYQVSCDYSVVSVIQAEIVSAELAC